MSYQLQNNPSGIQTIVPTGTDLAAFIKDTAQYDDRVHVMIFGMPVISRSCYSELN